MTNADHIRQMTDEELVKVILCNIEYCEQIQAGKFATACKRTKWIDDLSPCGQCMLKWLKAPYKEARP